MTPGSNRVTISWTQVQRVRARISHRLGQALPGDAIHNLSDVSTSAVVFLGFRLSRKGPTERYPHGLDRAEDLAGIGIAVVIWASAAFAGYQSIRKFIDHGATSHVALGIVGAALGIVGNQVVARYKLIVGGRESLSGRPQELSTHTPGLAGQDELCGSKSRAGSILIFRHARPMRWAARSPTPWPGGFPEAGSFTWTTRAAPA